MHYIASLTNVSPINKIKLKKKRIPEDGVRALVFHFSVSPGDAKVQTVLQTTVSHLNLISTLWKGLREGGQLSPGHRGDEF